MLRKSYRPGFTLVEILVVVTIIILLTGLAVPTINAFMSNRKLKAVTGRFVRGLYQARARAITDHDRIYIFFFKQGMLTVGERSGSVNFEEYFENEREMRKMRIMIRFADVSIYFDPKTKLLKSELPEFKKGEWMTKPVSKKDIEQMGMLGDDPVYLVFNSEGTIELGQGKGPGDVLSFEYMQEKPVDADFVFEEMGSEDVPRGWIDIRQTGNISEKIAMGTLSDDTVKQEKESR
jgi:prepilin-type N-terminal cleavage/methylation domain-containing protein